MDALTPGTRVRHVVADASEAPRGHRSGTVLSVDPDGLLSVEWREVAAYLQPHADSERARAGAYVNRMHPTMLVAF